MKKCRAQNELKTEYLLPERVLLSKDADGAEQLLCERERQPFLDETPVCVIKKAVLCSSTSERSSKAARM